MRCWNCGHNVSKKARVCGHCEADLTERLAPQNRLP